MENYINLPDEGVHQIIRLGAKYSSKEDVICAAHRLCKSQGREYQVVENRPSYYKINCISAPLSKFVGEPNICQFCIFAKPEKDASGDVTGRWSIYKFVGNHSCDVSCGAKRKQYDRSIIEALSKPVRCFVPNAHSRIGSIQQVQAMARASTGVELKRHQAAGIVQNKRKDAVHIHIGQFLLLWGYIQHLQQCDPGGTFYLEVEQCEFEDLGVNQFVRCYVAFSFAKRVWRFACIKVVVADGTFTKHGVFKQTILLAVAKNANGNLVLLAYAICNAENAKNWLWFLSKLIDDFPGMNVFLSDYDKGVEAASFQTLLAENNIAFSRCLRHMLANCATGLKKTITELTKRKVYEAARAKTEDQYKHSMSDLKAMDERVHDWLAPKMKQWATIHFLSIGKSRHGNLLNNMAEQYNSIILELRALPILSFCIKLQEYQCEQYTKNHYMSMQWQEEGHDLVKTKRDYHYCLVDRASKRICAVRPSAHPIYHGVVSSDLFEDSTKVIDVKLNLETMGMSCRCNHYAEFKEPCHHVWCTLLKIRPSSEASPLYAHPLNWYHRIFSTESFDMAYSPMLPSFGISGNLKIVMVVPPKENQTKGRPKKLRYISQSDKPLFCKACGNSGHNQNTCRTPTTQIRWENYKREALLYAKEVCKDSSFL